jgi:catechol 2,3-dioxygenase-like lactoylglutathione lyase family enzyme
MTTPVIQGIHHLKFPVADLDRSLAFYSAVFGARRLTQYDHLDSDGRLYAYILSIPNLGTALELRLNGPLATRQQGFDPVTLTVDTRVDLLSWAAHLDSLGLRHSGVLVGAVGWLLAFEDPDERRLRLYTREAHGPELTVSTSTEWLG